MPTPPVKKIFVYGSLRAGRRYRHLVDDLVVASRPATVRGRMYHYAAGGSRGEFPYLEPGDDLIYGDVLEFSDFERALAIIDELEEHPHLYRRRLIDVTYDDGRIDTAHVYFIVAGKERQGRRVSTGDWTKEVES